MAIFEDVSAQMKDALKAKDEARLAALRGIRAAFLNECKKDNSTTLSDETAIGLLRKLEKQRQESIDAFTDAGRPERADAERAELAVIRTFLPQLADEATTRRWVEEAIAASGATSGKEIGKVMGALMKAHKGELDAGRAREIAMQMLGA
ncbi:MAG: glutamyl-tRNA amidotransferase [Proteobacteria bacterium]|nr:MAG: glutamyl-tRNA amidotransferase [Pseudomonadota bacterium]